MEYRLLLLGSMGKTTFLYWNKLQEIVRTMPTIGFNVESFQVNQIKYVLWDIGGCDKIKRLVTHYYEGTHAIIYFINSSSKENLENSLKSLEEFILDFSLPQIPIVYFFNFRDLPESSILDYKTVLELSMPIISKFNDRPYIVQFGSSFAENKDQKAQGQKEIFIWLESILKTKDWSQNTKITKTTKNIKAIKSVQEPKKDQNGKFEWMIINDKTGKVEYKIYSSPSDELSDEELVEKTSNFELSVWDHKTHLRLAYVVLLRDGRRLAVLNIMELIENFIKNSKNTNGKTFHLTMTYFWIHMVHLATVLFPKISFSDLLDKCPWLMNGGLFKYFYSDELMLKDGNSRIVFHPPDKLPFPSIIPA